MKIQAWAQKGESVTQGVSKLTFVAESDEEKMQLGGLFRTAKDEGILSILLKRDTTEAGARG